MPHRPNYDTARQEAGFGWWAAVGVSAYRELAGAPLGRFNLEPAACIEVYRAGRQRARELFGDTVSYAGPATPPVSYGHLSCLGGKLLFPEDGEVNFEPLYGSLEEGIAALGQPVDFARAGLAPFYLDFREELRAAFPGEKVGFSFGPEGPVTTAWELRGHGFFTDLLDRPALVDEYLRLVTASVVAYGDFYYPQNGGQAVSPRGCGMCDDVASMVPPRLWRDLVLPHWEAYYQGRTTGRRHAHVEDLRPEQLPLLEEIGLDDYDPSVSPRLNPRIIYERCRVPFAWRLPGFIYRDLSATDVEDFVYQAAAEGASSVFTSVEACMCNPADADKVRAFAAAAQRVEELLAGGAERREVGELVTPGNRERFFGYRGEGGTQGE